jgi:hypothetical protein
VSLQYDEHGVPIKPTPPSLDESVGGLGWAEWLCVAGIAACMVAAALVYFCEVRPRAKITQPVYDTRGDLFGWVDGNGSFSPYRKRKEVRQ